MAFIGGMVYYIQHVTSFWAAVLGIFKALFWPAVLMYKLLELLKIQTNKSARSMRLLTYQLLNHSLDYELTERDTDVDLSDLMFRMYAASTLSDLLI